MGHAGSHCCSVGRARARTAADCPTRSRTRARSASPRSRQPQPWRERRTPAGRLAARRRLPAAYGTPRRTESVAAEPPWRPRPPARLHITCHCPCLPCTGWLHPRGNQPEFKNRNQPKSNRSQPKSNRSQPKSTRNRNEMKTEKQIEKQTENKPNTTRKTNRNTLGRGGNPPGPAASVGEQVRSRPPAPSYAGGGGPLPFD